MTRKGNGWMIALVSAAVLAVLAALPPLVSEGPRALLMEAFSDVCHQMAARSPHLGGVALAVCHRCWGIYVGLLAGVVAFPLLRAGTGPAWPLWNARIARCAPWVLGLALLPAATDWAGDLAGWWVNTPASRTLTGALFGVVAGFYFARAFVRAPAPVPAQEAG